MSRSGYCDDMDDQWAHIRWRGAVASAMRGKRGQAFLREMLAALDAMPEKKLITNELEHEGAVCAIGSVGQARGIDMSKIDPEDYRRVASVFGIAEPMAQEIVYMNDEAFDGYWCKTPEERFQKMRAWIASQIKDDPALASLQTQERDENLSDRRANGTHPSGEQNPAAKITAETVSRIKADFKAGVSRDEICRTAGISRTQMYRIVKNKSWTEIINDEAERKTDVEHRA